ncbi:MAG: PQQ-binding-like beta-propeller repeat protein, partial [Planctomycetota bacterium]
IRKQDDFDTAMEQISSFRSQQQTDKAFEVYNQLIRDYGDLRANEKLQTEMRQVSQMESQLVKQLEIGMTTASAFRESPISATTILASKNGNPINSLSGEILPILCEGSVYGLDVGDGSVIWRIFVGYQTDIQPQETESGTILVSDQLNQDVLLVSANEGAVIWRSEIGEPFLNPVLDGSRVIVTTASGKLIRLGLENGVVQNAVKIPQTANVQATKSNRNGLIYQPGFYSNLYILSDEDLSCQDVYYLGHRRGSIAVPPVVWNSFVLVAVNQSGRCDLHVLRFNSETGSLEPAQRIRPVTAGIVTNPLQRFGRFMLINSESGDLKILELNTAEEINPVRVLADEQFENRDNIRTYLATAGSQLWIGSKGMMRYKVSRALGTFERQKITDPDDYFVGPIHQFGDAIVHTRKRAGSAMTSVSAVNAQSLDQIWRTDLGGPLVSPPVVNGNQLSALTSQGDLFTIDSNSVGDNSNLDSIKSSNIEESLLFEQKIPISDSKLVCLSASGRPDMLVVDLEKNSSKLIKLPQPADQATCRSIKIGEDLIIASKTGQIVRIDPNRGRIVGTPFLPPVNPGQDINWFEAGLVSGNRFVTGYDNMIYLVDASDRSVLKNVAAAEAPGLIQSRFAAIGDNVYFTVSESNKPKLVAAAVGPNGLTIAGSAELPAASLDGPWNVDGRIIVQLGNETLCCFDEQLGLSWSQPVAQGTLATAPISESDGIRLYFNDGRMLNLLASDGSVQSEFRLGQPISHAPIYLDGRAIFSGLDGTLHVVPTAQ